MNRPVLSSLSRIAAPAVAALMLASCGVFGGTRSSTPSTPATPGSLVGPPRTASTSASIGTPMIVSASGTPSSTVSGQGPSTEVIGFDVLPDSSVADADEIGALAYGIEAAADPFRITISTLEQACLTSASDGLTDDQIDDALAWDETSGNFTKPIADCLTPANREAFAVWHQIDIDLADASDEQYRCVEQGLTTGATRQHLEAALTSCSVNS